MQFKKNVHVNDAQGKKVGELDRVVIDPRGGEVTHIVIQRGFIFNDDKVVPVELIERTDDEQVRLNVDAEQLKQMPNYIDVNFVPLDQPERTQHGVAGQDAVQPVYWYPPAGVSPTMWGAGFMGAIPTTGVVPYPYKLNEKENIPQGSVALKEGAKVIGRDGQPVGEVEKVLMEDEQNAVTHLLVGKGPLHHERRLVPANWINRIKEDGVELSVTADFVLHLRNYT